MFTILCGLKSPTVFIQVLHASAGTLEPRFYACFLNPHEGYNKDCSRPVSEQNDTIKKQYTLRPAFRCGARLLIVAALLLTSPLETISARRRPLWHSTLDTVLYAVRPLCPTYSRSAALHRRPPLPLSAPAVVRPDPALKVSRPTPVPRA